MSIDEKAFEAAMTICWGTNKSHEISIRATVEAYEDAKAAEQPDDSPMEGECHKKFQAWMATQGGNISQFEYEAWKAGYRANKRESGWQPIGTAPKDGTRVLCYDKHGSCWILYWDKENGWRDEEMGFDPTHWMPLPNSPRGTPL